MSDRRVILVYKTNVSTHTCRDSLHEVFSSVSGIVEWSVDLEDCDKVLRVVCDGAPSVDVPSVVRKRGYECDELE